MDLITEKWEDFLLSDLFDIKKGKRLTSADQEEGDNNYIGAIDSNNGIANHIGQKPIHKGNTITLSYNGSVGEAFYQKDDYWATDDVNALYSKYNGFNCKIGLFMSTVIRQEKYKFTYGRKWTLDNMNNTVIKLPVKRNQQGIPIIDEDKTFHPKGYIPDWQFMEDYIETLHHKPITTKLINNADIELSVDDWEQFKIEKLFTKIYKAKAHTKEEVTVAPQGMNFVSRTEENNGIDLIVQNDDLEGIEDGNCITIGDTTATCFYQKDRFITGDHMVVLRSDWMNQSVGLFIVTLLNCEKYRYCYGRAFKMDTIKSTLLKLPIKRDEQGKALIDGEYRYHPKGYIPDWQFMEDYINSLPYSDRI